MLSENRSVPKTKGLSGKAFRELAVKNVRKSAGDYLIYFFTLLFSVCLFYAFNSISAQFSMLGIDDSLNFLSFASGMILMVSVFICMVIGGLVVYANRFLLKRRKKEIGIYITLGMEQKDILALLMRETVLIGGISLITGIAAGIFVSQGLALVTARIMGNGIARVHFFFSAGAAVKSVLFFAVVFFFVQLFNAREIRKLKLIDLIYAGRKNEVLELGGSLRKVLLFLASLILIAGGYAWTLTRISKNMGQAVGIGTVLISAGTLLFFLSVADTMIRVLGKRKKFYYRGLNMFVLRQVASRMNSNIFSMTVISILMFASVTTIAVGLGGGKSIIAGSNQAASFDISFKEYAQRQESGSLDRDLRKLSIAGELEKLGLHTQTLFQTMEEISVYYMDAVNGSLFLGKEREENQYLNRESEIALISVQDYNRAMKQLGNPEVTLGEQEYALNYNVREVRGIYERFAQEPKDIVINGVTLSMRQDGLYSSSYETSTLLMDNGTLIVPEEVLIQLKPQRKILNCMFLGDGEDGYARFREEMLKLPDLPQWKAKEEVRVQIFSDTILFSYLGIYLGMIFLMTAGAVLALQQLSQSADNVKRYELLGRLGTAKKKMRQSVLAQLLLYFGIPMSIAGIHAAVIIRGIFSQLTNLSTMETVQSILFSVVVTCAIYSIYFVTTYLGSIRMLDSEKDEPR